MRERLGHAATRRDAAVRVAEVLHPGSTHYGRPRAEAREATVLGLPDGVRAALFDLDGVLTDTAAVHSAAWKHVFDDLLRERGGSSFAPFTDEDYVRHVDGRPRTDGVRAFLESRGVHLPEGEPDDPPGAGTVAGVGNRKNEVLQAVIARDGVEVFEGSRAYLQEAERAGLRRAVVSSSANTEQVLAVTGLERWVEARVDGLTLRAEGLRGKPAPDAFLAGARALGVAPAAAAVFEDALSGVEAGRAGGFALVVGVDRLSAGTGDHARALLRHGADVVVADLGDLL